MAGGGQGGFGGGYGAGKPDSGYGGMGIPVYGGGFFGGGQRAGGYGMGMPYGGMGGGDPNYFSYPGQRTRELYSRQPSKPPIMSEPFRPPQNELSGVGGSGFSNIPGNIKQPTQLAQLTQPTQPNFNAQVVPPGAVGGDLGNPIYSGLQPTQPTQLAQLTQPTQPIQPTQPTQPAPTGFSGGLGNLGNLRNLPSLESLIKPFRQLQAATPVEQKGSMPAPFVPSGGYGTEQNQYAAPNPGNVSMGLNPLSQATSAQQAYDQALAQYNSPEYAAYYNSLAPSTRAFMNKPGDPATGRYLAEQARANYNAFQGQDPFARGMKAGGITGGITGGIPSLLSAYGKSTKEGTGDEDNIDKTPKEPYVPDADPVKISPNYKPYVPRDPSTPFTPYVPSKYNDPNDPNRTTYGTIGRNISPSAAAALAKLEGKTTVDPFAPMKYQIPSRSVKSGQGFGKPFLYEPGPRVPTKR